MELDVGALTGAAYGDKRSAQDLCLIARRHDQPKTAFPLQLSFRVGC
jgi:hypothetical protein